MHDLVIRNANIYDGLGNPPVFGDLAVSNGRIDAIGQHNGGSRTAGQALGPGKTEHDAEGQALTPGIIDLHTHYDAQLTWDPYARPSIEQGVSTVVIGNCGFTIAPCRERDRDITLRNLTHVEGMSLDALRAGVVWNFETYPQYLDALAAKGSVPNVCSFVGHSSVRTYVLGDEASERAATPGEVEQMRELVVGAMRAGACGFATSTLEQHNGENGIPMPSRLADEHEMFELTGALGEVGKGVFMLTKGMTTTVPWLEEIARRNRRPVMIAAMLIDPNDPDRVANEVEQIGSARARGRELWGQVGPVPLTMEFCLRHPYPLEAFMAWRPAMEVPDCEAFLDVLASSDFRAAVKAEARTTGVPNRFSYHQFEHMRFTEVTRPEHEIVLGQIIGDLARAAGKDPFDWLLDFAADGGLDAMIDCKMLNVDEGRVQAMLDHDHTAVALSDAGAHLSFLCDAGFGLHLYGHWVRERGSMPLERAVQRITSAAADVYRIKDRGRLVPGAWADLALFDPQTVGRGEKRRVNDLPAGAARVEMPAVGVKGVWVNGERAVDENGAIEGCAQSGQLLRDFAD
ncbi:MAG: N-acyl-D-amino-acid deacylase family protein [Gammaproteobacteria bacterium]